MLTLAVGSKKTCCHERLQVIVMGAEQNGLPKDYQEKLRAIKTNTYEGPLPVMAELERARRRANQRSDA